MNKLTTFAAICLLSLMATAMQDDSMAEGDMEMEEDMESEGM